MSRPGDLSQEKGVIKIQTERFHPVLTRGLQRHLYSDIIMAIINSILAVTTGWWKKWIKPRSGVFVKDLLTWFCQFQLTFILADISKVKATRKMPMTRRLLCQKVQKRQVWEEVEGEEVNVDKKTAAVQRHVSFQRRRLANFHTDAPSCYVILWVLANCSLALLAFVCIYSFPSA